MLVAALLIGALTAFYFGLRPGAYAAGGTAAACLVAAVVPSLATVMYLAIGVFAVAVGTIGPRRANPTHAAKVTKVARQAFAYIKARLP